MRPERRHTAPVDGLSTEGRATAALRRWAARYVVAAPNASAPRAWFTRVGLRGRAKETLEVLGERIAFEVDEPEGEPRGTVLLIHGLNRNRAHLRHWSPRLTAAGLRVVRPDLPGHGDSSPGPGLTYGAREAEVLERVLEHTALAGRPAVVGGVSYGAATALQLAGRTDRVAAVCAVAGFASYRTIVEDTVRGFVPAGFLDGVLARAAALAAFDPAEASAEAAVTRTQAPVLLCHGVLDGRVPFSHAERIRRAAPARVRLEPLRYWGHFAVEWHPQVRRRSEAFLRAHGGAS